MKFIIYGAMLASFFACNNGFSETLYVDSITTTAGNVSNQSLRVLDSLEQANTQDNWSTYIEAAPDNSKFVGTFLFKAPIAKHWEKLELQVNTIGERKSVQRWQFQLRDFMHNKWVTVGDNGASSAWVWLSQSVVINSDVNNFVDTQGEIKLRYLSNNATDVSNIDLITIEITQSNVSPPNETQWWQPSPNDNLTWQWQINGSLDTSLAVDMYDIDLFDTSATTISNLKNSGKIVICYFSAGTYEGWRSDWQQFFPFITDDKYTGNQPPFAGNMAQWDERWLDIRRMDLLEPIMRSRMQMAQNKGCDGVEPDNMDAYTNGSETAISLTASEQLNYNKWIAALAHEYGLSVGLKNDVSQLNDLVDDFDWALNEQCFEYEECEAYSAFTNAGKAVFGVEYTGDPSTFCPLAISQNLFWLKKKLSLNAWRVSCNTD